MKASWKCKAKPTAIVPEDCNWPYCGCDPHVEKIIEHLIECGWQSPKDAFPAAEAIREALKEAKPYVEMCCGMIVPWNAGKAENALAKITAALALIGEG